MADLTNVDNGDLSDFVVLTNEVTDGVLGTGKKQYVGIMDATVGGTNKWQIDSSGRGLVFVSGAVTVSSTPAASRNGDSISSAVATDAVMNGVSAIAPQFAKIVASGAGATTIVSAVATKKIRVLAWDLTVLGAVNAKWQSHVLPTDLTGLYYFAANGGITRDFNPVGYFETIAGEALDINLSSAIAVGGALTYIVI